jgi:WD40 repeat protein
VWRVDDHGAQRVSADGSPFGPVRSLPAGFHADPGFNGGATPDLVGLIRQIPNVPGPAGLDFRLWNPDTGRSLIPSDACDGVTSTPTLAAYIPCEDKTVRLIDMRTGRTRTIPIKAGYGAATSAVLSPDGTHLAVALGGVSAGETALAFTVIDLRTGDVKVFANPYGLTPVEWSPDSKTLVLIGDAGGSNQLAYWQPGMSQPAAIRLGVITDESHLAVLE